MFIYLIEPTAKSRHGGYDTFDSAVVIAESRQAAALIHPQSIWGTHTSTEIWNQKSAYGTWVNSPNDVDVTYIGRATSTQELGTVICASFNAG
jgi:hypothetical protein